MRLGWRSKLKFEPRGRRIAINHRSLSGPSTVIGLIEDAVTRMSPLHSTSNCCPLLILTAIPGAGDAARSEQLLMPLRASVAWSKRFMR